MGSNTQLISELQFETKSKMICQKNKIQSLLKILQVYKKVSNFSVKKSSKSTWQIIRTPEQNATKIWIVSDLIFREDWL